jgi:2-C-methyl-D-erythritol 4-phosphate cytidylyltransferase
LWRAQTPQAFRYRLLVQALSAADALACTDESQAVERLGQKPRLVRGSAANLKVTYAEDLTQAAAILARETSQGRQR